MALSVLLGLAGLTLGCAVVLRTLGVPIEPGAIVDARDRMLEHTVAALPWPAVTAFPVRQWLRHVLFAPHFFVALAALLALEQLVPVRPTQRSFSVFAAHDFLWFLAQLGIFFGVIGWFAAVLAGVYQRHLDFLTVRAVEHWPAWLRAILGLVAIDFLAWLHHLVRHKVRVFWCFHTVHHAQRQLNPWTDSRYHLVEYFVAESVRFVPLLALQLDAVAVVGLAWLMAWHARLYHGNIRSNFGVLRYVLVTPQSHRVHHSVLPEHQDRNFGVVFSIWDHLFGTQCRDYDAYPETGVREGDFPHESGWRSVISLRAFAAQQLYPFRLAWRVSARGTGGRPVSRGAA